MKESTAITAQSPGLLLNILISSYILQMVSVWLDSVEGDCGLALPITRSSPSLTPLCLPSPSWLTGGNLGPLLPSFSCLSLDIEISVPLLTSFHSLPRNLPRSICFQIDSLLQKTI